MSIICVKIAQISHNMLVKFADTQQTADLVEQCRNASAELSGVVEKLEKTLKQANQIVQESQTQKEVTGEVGNSFHQVNGVSNTLLEISR